MSPKQTLVTHRSWEDWAVVIIAFAIMAFTNIHSSGHVPGTQVPAELINVAVIGVLLIILGVYEIAEWSRAVEFAIFACGAWLIASPFMFGFTGDAGLALGHYVFGTAVLALATLEIWQDWGLPAGPMQHSSH